MVISNQLDFSDSKRLKVTLVRSASGRLPKHKATLNALGLRRIDQTISVANNNAMIGMLRIISYLIKVEKE